MMMGEVNFVLTPAYAGVTNTQVTNAQVTNF